MPGATQQGEFRKQLTCNGPWGAGDSGWDLRPASSVTSRWQPPPLSSDLPLGVGEALSVRLSFPTRLISPFFQEFLFPSVAAFLSLSPGTPPPTPSRQPPLPHSLRFEQRSTRQGVDSFHASRFLQRLAGAGVGEGETIPAGTRIQPPGSVPGWLLGRHGRTFLEDFGGSQGARRRSHVTGETRDRACTPA